MKNTAGKSPATGSTRFLILFGVFLIIFYFATSIRPVNDHVVVPFTAAIASVSGWLLNVSGQGVHVAGTTIASAKFGVNIENGCNGLEAILLVASAMLAFPARWPWKAFGFIATFVAIEILNLFRVMSLYWIGVHRPGWFDSAHTLVWQCVVILFGVTCFLIWAGLAVKVEKKDIRRAR